MYLFFQGLHSLQMWFSPWIYCWWYWCVVRRYFVCWTWRPMQKAGFGKSIDNGNIHSCFCKFAFLKLFAIAADCIRTQNWEAKKEVYIKSRKIRNRIVELLRKFACICTPCLCFYVASSGMGKNYYFSKRCFPWTAACFRLASLLSLPAFAPFVFPWLSPLL